MAVGRIKGGRLFAFRRVAEWYQEQDSVQSSFKKHSVEEEWLSLDGKSDKQFVKKAKKILADIEALAALPDTPVRNEFGMTHAEEMEEIDLRR